MLKSSIILSIILVIAFFGQVSAEEYKIDAEDVLQITVYDQPDLATKVRVTAQGDITVPLVGNVKVSGFTVAEAERKIAALLEEDYLVNPRVNVFIEEYHSKKVSVLGAVEKPGVYELSAEKPTTVLEAVAMAGGLTKKAAASDAKVMRVEEGREITIPIDIFELTKQHDKEKDIPLKAKDVIFIPEGFYQVSVLGAVEKPGSYELSREKQTTVIEALAMAGGLTKDAAAGDAKIMRIEGGKEITIPVDIFAITKRHEKDRDVPLKPKDVIFIPEGFFQIFVLGAVEKPGSYELSREKSTTVVEAIAMAGGFSKIAAQNDTKVIRKTPDGKEENIKVRVADITQKGEKDKDITLQAKDVVFVPESFF